MAWVPLAYLVGLPLGIVSYIALRQLDKRRRRAFQLMALDEACFVCGQLQQPAGGTCSECGDHPTAHVHLREPEMWPPVWDFGRSEWRALWRAFTPNTAQRYGWACWGGLVKAISRTFVVGGFALFWTGWDRSIMPTVLGVAVWSAALQISIRHLELRPERTG